MKKVCYTIDTEGDAPSNIFSTYFGIELVLPKILDLFELHDVKATFFIQEDMSVKIGSQYPTLLEKIQDGGHEIGYHAHGLVGSNLAKQEEIITSGIKKLRDMGYKIESFRAERYHFDAQILKILEKNSIKYDSSVIPDLNEIVNNEEWNNHIGAPHQPYFPSYEDHRKKGSSKILEIPISRIRNAGSSFGGILEGWRTSEKDLFKYFYKNIDDQIIIISIHPWHGLSNLFGMYRRKQELLKKKRYAIITKILGSGLGFSNQLINRKYFEGFSDFIKYISEKDIKYVPIKLAGNAWKKSFRTEKSLN